MFYRADTRMGPSPQRGLFMIGIRVCTKSITSLRFEGEKTHFTSDTQLLKGARNILVRFNVEDSEANSVAGS